ncbi:MAG: hypothetical protein JJT99_11060 [Rhodobacteraceae bacterium]|nr:hypothetical protein [Paracoccaceae bacterium]
MGAVVTLQYRESVVVDKRRIARIFRSMGAPCAEGSIITQVQALTSSLHRIDAHLKQDDLSELSEGAGKACKTAHSIGLLSLSTALGNLQQVSLDGDVTAIRAVWQRCCRVGDASLVELWQLPQLRM